MNDEVNRKKKQAEEKAIQEKNAAEAAKIVDEENARILQQKQILGEEANQEGKTQDADETLQCRITTEEHPEWSQHAKKLQDEYDKQFSGRRRDNVLIFHSEQELIAFFDKQAEAGLKYIAEEVDSSGNLTGRIQFSCGDGNRYSGTDKDILIALQIQLGKLNENDGENKQQIAQIEEGINVLCSHYKLPKPTPQQSSKEQLSKEQIQALRAKAPSTNVDDSQEQSTTTPTPLKTSPSR